MAKYQFGQIAINSTEKKNPVDEDRFTYLGLEHLDSGSLKVTRFGSEVAPIGEKLVMRKGDVLFGKRRAYQKKVAIAPFDGIFSAHGMVLRPKEDVIDKDFFPLFISSDYFLDAAIKISVGSLSPTINWRDLKGLEFELPDMDAQRKLVKVLWSINDTMEAYKKMISATEDLVKSQFIEWFGNPISHEKDESLPMIGQVCKLKAGQFVKAEDIREEGGFGRYPCYGGNGLRGYVADYTHDGEFPIIGRQGALCGNVQYAQGKFHATEHAVVVTPMVSMNQYWLYHLLLLLNLNRYATGAAQPGLAVGNLERIHIQIPELFHQESFSSFAHQSDKSKFAVRRCSNLNFSGSLSLAGRCMNICLL